MGTPSNRVLKNQNTGFDLSVPSVQEVDAPLGGTSTEYEILILTNLQSYKTFSQKNEDVTQISVYKAYREIEDFYIKIFKKFTSASFPSIPKGNETFKCSTEQKRKAADIFMKYVAQNKEICDSSLFDHFLGIRSRKSSLSTSADKNHSCSDVDFSHRDHVSEGVKDTSEEKSKLKSAEVVDIFDDPEVLSNNISDMFPKMKIEKSSSQQVVANMSEILPAESKIKAFVDDDDDLFEEVKRKTKVEETKTQDSKLHGLFDHLEGNSSNLFQAKDKLKEKAPVSSDHSTESKISVQPRSDVVKNINRLKAEPENNLEEFENAEHVDEKEKEIVLQNRKAGEISLFEEQDLGEYITNEEEDLFLVPGSKETKTQRNPLLSPNDEVTQNEVNEFLEDLIKIPSDSPKLSEFTVKKSSDTEQVIEPKPKPVPKPRPSILTEKKNDTSKQAPDSRPVPKPRSKSSAAAEGESKLPPIVPPRKRASSKPAPPPKPAVPPKPSSVKPSKIAQSNTDLKSHETDNASNVVTKLDKTNQKDDLDSFDILKYIEQEEKAKNEDVGLFD